MASTTLIASMRVVDVNFRIKWGQEHATQAAGNPRVADVAEPFWMAQLTTTALNRNEARLIEGMVDGLRGSISSFYIWNPTAQRPIADPNGLILGASIVTINAHSALTITLEGLPAGYVFNIGDMFSYDYSSSPVRRRLHRLTSAGVANGSGVSPALSVAPNIPNSDLEDIVATLIRPAAEMILLPDTFEMRHTGMRASATIQATQVV